MLGLITIGQAPRDDVIASMFGAVKPMGIGQFGALDGMPQSEIRKLRPDREDSVLVSRLTDGTEVELGKRRITPLVQDAIRRAVAAGCSAICVLCTGSFNGLSAPVPILFPDRVLSGVVDALLPVGTLGVLMPHEGQRGMMVKKWTRSHREVVTVAASPYTATASLASVATDLKDRGAELIVMDCMGFTRAMEHVVREAVEATPVLLSNAVVGAVIAEAWGLHRPSDQTLAV